MLIAHLYTRSRVFRFSFSRPRRTMSMSMSMWSLRWHFTNKTVTGAPYSIKSYSLSHSWTLRWTGEYDDWNMQCRLEVAAELQQRWHRGGLVVQTSHVPRSMLGTPVWRQSGWTDRYAITADSRALRNHALQGGPNVVVSCNLCAWPMHCRKTNRVTLLVTLPNIHGFKNNFTGRVSSKPFLIWLLTTPPHPKYAALVIYC